MMQINYQSLLVALSLWLHSLAGTAAAVLQTPSANYSWKDCVYIQQQVNDNRKELEIIAAD